MENIKIGFEGGSSETRLKAEAATGSGSCYEIFIASISVVKEPSTQAAGPGGNWSTSGPSLVPMMVQMLGQGLVTGCNMAKACMCLSWTQDFALNEALFGTWPVTDGMDMPNNTGRWLSDTGYLYFDKRQVCSPCDFVKCKCRANKVITIDVTNKTTEYTASDGTTIKLTHPGDHKKVVEQIVKAELAIKLDCAKGTADYYSILFPPFG